MSSRFEKNWSKFKLYSHHFNRLKRNNKKRIGMVYYTILQNKTILNEKKILGKIINDLLYDELCRTISPLILSGITPISLKMKNHIRIKKESLTNTKYVVLSNKFASHILKKCAQYDIEFKLYTNQPCIQFIQK